jgi:hypothetical protein
MIAEEFDVEKERERRDWEDNERYPWRFSPMTMCVLLAATLTLAWLVGTLLGG